MPNSAPALAAASGRWASFVRRSGLARWWPGLLGAAWITALLGPLLPPSRALANRDIVLFHLPLRTCFRNLLFAGRLPLWNPWLNGGQPILSNPSYSAFYPPTWLALPLPPAYALSALAVLHAAIAFAGAWRLARRLGAGRGAAALAAVGYTGSGAVLSLLNAYTLFCSMAWFPWALAWGDEALRAPRRAWLRPALLCGAALAMQLLNGEPSTVMVSGLALLALAASVALDAGQGDAGQGARLRALRIALPPLAAAALAAVQLVPTAARLAGTIRSHGLEAQEATLWSARPGRLVEVLFPRFFGDVARHGEGLFFGRGLHDLGFPYIASLYPGLLVTLLAVAALSLWPVPRRAAWLLCAAAGSFLALGRHNPLYEPARQLLAPLAAQRYPERFAVLAIAPLAFAAALAWQRLLDERRAGRTQAAELPMALGLVTLATAAALTCLAYQAPALAAAFLRDHLPLPLSPAAVERGLALLRREGWAAIATAGAVTALLAACRWRRPRADALTALAIALLAGDLWHYGHELVRTVPADDYRRQPPLLDRMAAPGQRVFIETLPEERHLPLARGDADRALARAMMDRLLPYSAAIWRVPYALNDDFDRMLTHWGWVALEVLRADLRQKPEMAFRLLGAWGVKGMLLRATTAAGTPETAPLAVLPDVPVNVPRRLIRNDFTLPTYRFVPRVSFHPSYASALYIARAQGYTVDRQEHCAAPGRTPATVAYTEPPQVIGLHPEPSRLNLQYRAAGGCFFVAAVTYDEGWEAVVDGARAAVYPTALGQIGVELPPGEHHLTLAYHDPLVAAGAAVSLLAAAAGGLLFARQRRPPPAAAAADENLVDCAD
jgi:hypothetical protein